jgi:YHS domain-containing protein
MIASRSWGAWSNLMTFDPSSTNTARPLRPAGKPTFVTLCGRIFRDTDPAYFPQLQYRGRTIYLCTESCLHAMQADADRFYHRHRQKPG